MSAASTIIIARSDFSIPGSVDDDRRTKVPVAQMERRFFELVATQRPDLIVLDLTKESTNGLEAIRKIRELAGLPVLVVHKPEDPRHDDYRVSGGVGCLPAPVDIVKLNEAIQRIIALAGAEPRMLRDRSALGFGGMIFRPDQNALSSADGASVQLTTLENAALKHLALNPRRVCSRNEIAQALYGNGRGATDRAIDIVINRLRKKLTAAGGQDGLSLLKTEFGRGYTLLADVSVSAPPPSS